MNNTSETDTLIQIASKPLHCTSQEFTEQPGAQKWLLFELGVIFDFINVRESLQAWWKAPRSASVSAEKASCFSLSLPAKTENLCSLVTTNKCLETWFTSNKEKTEERGAARWFRSRLWVETCNNRVKMFRRCFKHHRTAGRRLPSAVSCKQAAPLQQTTYRTQINLCWTKTFYSSAWLWGSTSWYLTPLLLNW